MITKSKQPCLVLHSGDTMNCPGTLLAMHLSHMRYNVYNANVQPQMAQAT